MDNSKLQSDIKIRDYALNEDIIKQPGLYAFYAELYSQKMRAASQAKTNLLVLEGEIHLELKQSAEKLTDKDKEKMLKSDPRYVLAKNQLDDAEAAEELQRGILEAFRQKSNMLCQLALRQRDEIKSNISIESPTQLGNKVLANLG